MRVVIVSVCVCMTNALATQKDLCTVIWSAGRVKAALTSGAIHTSSISKMTRNMHMLKYLQVISCPVASRIFNFTFHYFFEKLHALEKVQNMECQIPSVVVC